mmetsp:Transcript_9579/g.17377  ORF Transcript_9579/g.17377 Transcript_9579/m.17377 type:complete len:234 (+) Transcript_9579:205-906(+)
MRPGTQQVELVRQHRCGVDPVPVLRRELEAEEGGGVGLVVALVGGDAYDHEALGTVFRSEGDELRDVFSGLRIVLLDVDKQDGLGFYLFLLLLRFLHQLRHLLPALGIHLLDSCLHLNVLLHLLDPQNLLHRHHLPRYRDVEVVYGLASAVVLDAGASAAAGGGALCGLDGLGATAQLGCLCLDRFKVDCRILLRVCPSPLRPPKRERRARGGSNPLHECPPWLHRGQRGWTD